jgi:hypothetical protein
MVRAVSVELEKVRVEVKKLKNDVSVTRSCEN